jgi:ubiquinone/menaquinone biosynthesis C-methylase UbiE
MPKKTVTNIEKTQQQSITLKEAQEHYQDYPYPFRDPEDESHRLLALAGEYLGELNHHLYKGKKVFDGNFRCLVAGGVTGDSLIFLGEQLKNTNAELVYVDFSKASMEIAQKRAEKRGIKNIKWVLDSILNIPKLGLGKFDFINCSGVLHHLQSPPEGLKILQESLTKEGGMHIMVYAKYGRTGVYQIQEIMKMVNEGISNRAQEIMNCKTILSSLPDTNWFMRAQELIGDHINFGDIGVYDLFLHKQDRAYSIPELHEFIEDAGLNFIDFTVIPDRLALRIENYIKDFSLLQRLKKTDIVTQQAICELILGNIIKHSVYLSNQKDTTASLDDLNNIPYSYGIANLPKQVYHLIEDNNLAIGSNASMTLNNSLLKNVNIIVPISIYTKYIFKHMIGESNSLGEIFDLVKQELQQEVEDKVLIAEVKKIFTPFLISGIMLLRDKSLPLYSY